MADPNFKKISLMVEKTTAAATDFIPIVDTLEQVDANKNKKITASNLRKNITNAELAGAITAAKIAGLSTDPDADRVVFWDDSATSLAFLAPSTGLQVTDTTLTTKDSEIVHDNLSGFVAGEHVNHSVTITAGTGLAGGGDISANRTIALSHLGIQSLDDPNDDRIAFWDETAGAMKWLDIGTGLAISDTTLNAGDFGEGNIADGAVTNAKLGSDVGVWTAWTPTVDGWLPGYTIEARYALINNVLHFEICINGSSNSILATATPPFTSIEGGMLLPQFINGYYPVIGMCDAYRGMSQSIGLIYYDNDSELILFYPGTTSDLWDSFGLKTVIGKGTISYQTP